LGNLYNCPWWSDSLHFCLILLWFSFHFHFLPVPHQKGMSFPQFQWHVYHAYVFVFGTSSLHLFLPPLWRNGFRNLLTTTWSVKTMALESVDHHPPTSTLISLLTFFMIIKTKQNNNNNNKKQHEATTKTGMLSNAVINCTCISKIIHFFYFLMRPPALPLRARIFTFPHSISILYFETGKFTTFMPIILLCSVLHWTVSSVLSLLFLLPSDLGEKDFIDNESTCIPRILITN